MPPSEVRQVTPPKTSQPWLASLKSSSGVYPAPGGATSVVLEHSKRPARQAGNRVADGGDGGVKLAEYLASEKFV